MSDLAKQIVAGFESGSSMFLLQTSDIRQADAVRRARGEEGCSITWIGGHLLSFRGLALTACGQDYANPWMERFSMQSPATDGSDYPTLTELREEWTTLHDRVCAVVGALTDAQLRADSAMFGSKGGQSQAGFLQFCVSHEAYHLGALGMLRVLWGYRHTHVLAMEAKGIKAPG